MKNLMLFIAFFLTCSGSCAVNNIPGEDDPDVVISQLLNEVKIIKEKYGILISIKIMELKSADEALERSNSIRKKVSMLILKDKLKNDLDELKFCSDNDISKIRYLKGLQIIKILYEKVLSLDHHFASVRT